MPLKQRENYEKFINIKGYLTKTYSKNFTDNCKSARMVDWHHAYLPCTDTGFQFHSKRLKTWNWVTYKGL